MILPSSHSFTKKKRQLADLGMMVLESPCMMAGYQEIIHHCASWFGLDQAIRVGESRSLDPDVAAPTSFYNGLRSVTPELLETAEVYRSENPMLRTMIQHRDLSARQVSDLISRREWNRNLFYNEVCIPMGMRRVRAIELTQSAAPNSRIHALVLGRNDRRGFSAKEDEWLEQVRWTLRPILMHLEKKKADCERSPLTVNFTPREREVFHWLGLGKSNAEIAIIIGCATRTVEKHMEHILYKTGSENRSALVTRRA